MRKRKLVLAVFIVIACLLSGCAKDILEENGATSGENNSPMAKEDFVQQQREAWNQIYVPGKLDAGSYKVAVDLPAGVYDAYLSNGQTNLTLSKGESAGKHTSSDAVPLQSGDYLIKDLQLEEGDTLTVEGNGCVSLIKAQAD